MIFRGPHRKRQKMTIEVREYIIRFRSNDRKAKKEHNHLKFRQWMIRDITLVFPPIENCEVE